MHRMYSDLAAWWHLISPPEEYIEEVEFFMPLLAPITARPPVTMLELGSGGGNNALYMKEAFESVTLVDLSPEMLAASRQINPDCEHIQGDMRDVRLGQTFDVVFVHDAIAYMLTEEDLRRAMETAYLHCKQGGMALFVPDHVGETFEPYTDHGGSDGEDGRGIRYLEWSYADDTARTIITHYVFLYREGDQPAQIAHDVHVNGLFALDTWLALLRAVGFEAEFVMDSFERYVFIAQKP